MAHPLTGEKVVSESSELVIDISTMLQTLLKDPGEVYTVCVFRVSGKHREINAEAYTPRLVSIGPLHHGKDEFQAMEAYKLSCLRTFIEQNEVSIDKLVNFARQKELSVRGCYESTMDFSSNQFVQLILLDGIFVVELLLKSNSVHDRDKTDALYDNRWMMKDILHDMLLLENQLPLSFLQELFKFVKPQTRHDIGFNRLVFKYYKEVGNTEQLVQQEPSLITKIFGVDNTEQLVNGHEQKPSNPKPKHLIESLIYLHWPETSNTELNISSQVMRPRKFEYSRRAAELEEAGVTFRCGTGSFLSDVSFNKDKGELELPYLKVNDNTETFLRNAIAFEQCAYNENYITSYVILMDSLIDMGNDVDLLVKHNIIKNSIGENEKVAHLFNNLYKEVVENTKDFYFAEICIDLNTYSKDKWHMLKARLFKWTTMLMRDYFGNPWSIISFLAASTAVGLTLIQTICAFDVCKVKLPFLAFVVNV